MVPNQTVSTSDQEIGNPSQTADAVCHGRIGLLEFGPFTLSELADLTSDHALPEDLEIRLDGGDLWWSWPRIAIGLPADERVASSCLENWFTRVGDAVAGPLTIADVSTSLLSGELPTSVTIQIGDGPWRPVTDLLVPAEESMTNVAADASVPAPDVELSAVDIIPVDPVLLAADRQKHELEAWLAKTMPLRQVTVVIAPRLPTRSLDDVVADALVRVAHEMDDAARTLSYPWLWGTLIAFALFSLILMRSQPRGPDELELTALKKLKGTLEAIQAVRASQPDEATWNEFGESLIHDLDEIRFELANAKRANTPIKESLYWALEYRLPRILAEGRMKPCPSERQFQENLNEAERHMRPGAK
ncbi:MAG: hypothetical protein JWP89_1320 [Schlesneria sp.]|nr:hypothetical protein [Schlesneria sp.]